MAWCHIHTHTHTHTQTLRWDEWLGVWCLASPPSQSASAHRSAMSSTLQAFPHFHTRLISLCHISNDKQAAKQTDTHTHIHRDRQTDTHTHTHTLLSECHTGRLLYVFFGCGHHLHNPNIILNSPCASVKGSHVTPGSCPVAASAALLVRRAADYLLNVRRAADYLLNVTAE